MNLHDLGAVIDETMTDLVQQLAATDMESYDKASDDAYDTAANLGFVPDEPGTNEFLNLFTVLAHRFPEAANRIFRDVQPIHIGG